MSAQKRCWYAYCEVCVQVGLAVCCFTMPVFFPLYMGPVYNEFGYKEHLATASIILCIEIVDSNVKTLGYNDHWRTRSSFLRIIWLFVSGAQSHSLWQCKYLCPAIKTWNNNYWIDKRERPTSSGHLVIWDTMSIYKIPLFFVSVIIQLMSFQPPRIGGVKVYIENVKRDEIILDFELL